MDVIRMETMRLSITKLMLENACFLMQRDSMVAWPLICDPTSRVLDWLRNFYGHTGLVEVKYSVSHPCALKPPDSSLILKFASIVWLLFMNIVFTNFIPILLEWKCLNNFFLRLSQIV